MSKILDRHYQKDDVQSVANQGVLQQEDRKLRRGSARWLVSSRHNLNHSADVAAAVLDVVAEQPSIDTRASLYQFLDSKGNCLTDEEMLTRVYKGMVSSLRTQHATTATKAL